MNPEVESPNGPARTAGPIQPMLVLYLDKVDDIPYTSDAAVAEAFAKDPEWQNVSKPYGGPSRLVPQRAFKANPALLEAMFTKAAKLAERNGVRGYRPLRFDHYFLVPIPVGSRKPPLALYCDLQSGLPTRGGRAFFSMPTKPAAASTDYLGPSASGGVGVQPPITARNGQPIDGRGQAIVDIEKAWHTTQPQALPLPSSVAVQESAEPGDIGHGTAVAAILLGAGAVAPIAGVAPGARFYKAPCVNVSDTGERVTILASAIADATLYLEKLGKGILLIEQQSWDALPIETTPLEFAMIRTAAALGHIVIQPAGNRPCDLDGMSGLMIDPADESNELPRALDPTQGGLTSGAIVVAAGRSGKIPGDMPGDRSALSNHGNLIDCWAWGDSIATLAATRDANGNLVAYADPAGFGGTSGAAAIIAGVVALMQQMHAEAGNATPLTPPEVRSLLRNPAFGTNGTGDLSGVYMPDLALMKAHLDPAVPT